MKAIQLTRETADKTPTVSLINKDIPSPSQGDILIKVHASAIHPSDLLNSRGGFPYTTFPRIVGRDFAGTIVSGSRSGEEVYGTSGSTYAFTADGFQAEYGVVAENAIAPKPRNISFTQAACIGVPFTTAVLTLRRAKLQSSDTVLVIGASGAVGSAVVQLARYKGCTVLTAARDLTADICTVKDPELRAVDNLTQGRGVDVVIDTVGVASLLKIAIGKLAHGGRIAFIASSGFPNLELELRDFYRKEKSIIGCNSLSYSVEDMARIMADLSPMFENGDIRPFSEDNWAKISLEQAAEIYQKSAQKQVSKYVISME